MNGLIRSKNQKNMQQVTPPLCLVRRKYLVTFFIFFELLLFS